MTKDGSMEQGGFDAALAQGGDDVPQSVPYSITKGLSEGGRGRMVMEPMGVGETTSLCVGERPGVVWMADRTQEYFEFIGMEPVGSEGVTRKGEPRFTCALGSFLGCYWISCRPQCIRLQSLAHANFIGSEWMCSGGRFRELWRLFLRKVSVVFSWH